MWQPLLKTLQMAVYFVFNTCSYNFNNNYKYLLFLSSPRYNYNH